MGVLRFSVHFIPGEFGGKPPLGAADFVLPAMVKKKPLPPKRVEELALLTRCPEYPRGLFAALAVLAAELKRNEAHPLLDFFASLPSVDPREAREKYLRWHAELRPRPSREPRPWSPVPPQLLERGPRCVQVLYVDPPWSYLNEDCAKRAGTVGAHYKTCADDAIFGLLDDWLEPYLAPDCALLMWATGPKMHAALATMGAWRFEYKNKLCYWLKTYNDGRPVMGLGSYTRTCMEEILLGTRGNVLKYMDASRVTTLQVLETRSPPPVVAEQASTINSAVKHSEKPPLFREYVSKLFSGAEVKLELFTRNHVQGWVPWGDQVPNAKQKRIDDLLSVSEASS